MNDVRNNRKLSMYFAKYLAKHWLSFITSGMYELLRPTIDFHEEQIIILEHISPFVEITLTVEAHERRSRFGKARHRGVEKSELNEAGESLLSAAMAR